MTTTKPHPEGSGTPLQMPTGFTEVCALLGNITIGDKSFSIDMEAIARFMADGNWPQETHDELCTVWNESVSHFLVNQDAAMIRSIQELHRLVLLLRAQGIAAPAARKSAAAKVQNAVNAKKPRGSRDPEADERIKIDCIRLMSEGHTRREARGLMRSWDKPGWTRSRIDAATRELPEE